jgi:hypothetical protein
MMKLMAHVGHVTWSCPKAGESWANPSSFRRVALKYPVLSYPPCYYYLSVVRQTGDHAVYFAPRLCIALAETVKIRSSACGRTKRRPVSGADLPTSSSFALGQRLSAVPYKGTQGGFERFLMISLHSLPCQVHGRRDGLSQQWRAGQTRIPGDRRRSLQICSRQAGTEFEGGDDRNITAERFLSTQQELQQRPGSDYGEVVLLDFGASTRFLTCWGW